jgi:hypothetical protein
LDGQKNREQTVNNREHYLTKVPFLPERHFFDREQTVNNRECSRFFLFTVFRCPPPGSAVDGRCPCLDRVASAERARRRQQRDCLSSPKCAIMFAHAL